jgi:DNA-binding CsgD family transcriptional regulator
MAARLIEQVRGYLNYNLSWKPALDRVNCQLNLMQGKPFAALRVVEDWLAEPSEIPYEQGRIHECAAEAHLVLGDREKAGLQAHKALAIYSGLGAAARKKKIERWLEENAPRRRGRPKSRGVLNLTEREVEVLALVGSGHSNNEIAAKLFISPGTVKKHVSNIMDKTFVRHRRELISIAIGVVSGSDEPIGR